MDARIEQLKKRTYKVDHLQSTLNILEWDMSVNMPQKGALPRSETTSFLNTLKHEIMVNIDHDGILTSLKKDLDAGKLSEQDSVMVTQVWRRFERTQKVPEDFVREQSKLESESHKVWEEAREKSDFQIFKPYLEKIVELKRKETEFVGYDDSPYDALLDIFEPEMTEKEAGSILSDIRDFSVPFLKEIQSTSLEIDETKSHGHFPINEQVELNKYLAQMLGFDFDAGRLDVSTHPFSVGFHAHDVRITTRYREGDIWYSISPTVHETGHGLYEQGLPHEHFGTFLAEAISMGIHESQSKIWETQIGASPEFVEAIYPELQKRFPKPFAGLDKAEFYRIINKVTPSLIRVEADELTYNLHIIIRFEIEKALIKGEIKVEDLPEIWNAKYKEYIGVEVPNDKLGVLQDVHWSMGYIGYFPTYSFGNLYASQFYFKLREDIKDIDKKISSGQFSEIREWLRKKIHMHGKTLTAKQLIKEVTKEELNSKYFVKYIKDKYSKIYNLK
jgi:carboxypeptidase Taq